MQSEFPFHSVEPVAPPASYLGGKKQLAQRLASVIEQIPHAAYAEVFVGMGGVFLRRRLVPRAEIINDRSGDIATHFRILQRHYPQFMETLKETLKFQVSSRREYERLVACDPATLTASSAPRVSYTCSAWRSAERYRDEPSELIRQEVGFPQASCISPNQGLPPCGLEVLQQGRLPPRLAPAPGRGLLLVTALTTDGSIGQFRPARMINRGYMHEENLREARACAQGEAVGHCCGSVQSRSGWLTIDLNGFGSPSAPAGGFFVR